jgi:hypothetical protein
MGSPECTRWITENDQSTNKVDGSVASEVSTIATPIARREGTEKLDGRFKVFSRRHELSGVEANKSQYVMSSGERARLSEPLGESKHPFSELPRHSELTPTRKHQRQSQERLRQPGVVP